MRLQSCPKVGAGELPRMMPPEETIRRVRPFMKQIGVTRIADTTGLDTLGMPIFSAIRPDDAGPAGISVYNGKGLTKASSRAGAMMEAIERFCAETWHRPRQIGCYPEIRAANPDTFVMNPASMRLQQEVTGEPERVRTEWGAGWDLLGDRPVLVPLPMVLCPYQGPGEDIWTCSSNGLASGNTVEEAVSHALAELIERDALTIATVRTQVVPKVRAVLDALVHAKPAGPVEPDQSPAPSVRLDTVPADVRRLIRAAERDGSAVWLRDITSDLGIPTFVASMRRAENDGTELAAGGFGCDPSARIAAIRAITETAQGRNVQIQGVREDASAARQKAPDGGRVLWCADSDRWVSFADIPSYEHADILSDITLMLDRLSAAGVREVYAVDVSDPTIPASVVKMIIPEMECWFLHDFAADHARLGARAQRYLPHR
ncbi:MAG: YcaO-like family protein [Jatrophihabitans sp.]